MEEKLKNLLAKIAETAERRFCFLSEFPEWDEEMQNYCIEKYGHWNGVIEDGQLQLGRLLYKLLDWKHYNYSAINDDERVKLPFHCYAIIPDDVVFTEKRLEWDYDKEMYVGVMADVYRQMSMNLKHPELAAEAEKKPKQKPSAPSSSSSLSGCIVFLIAAIIIGFIIMLISH